MQNYFNITSLKIEKKISNQYEITLAQLGELSFFFALSAKQSLPANGGLRILPYPSNQAALKDCLRLTELMEVKHLLYGTGFSGVKIVANAIPTKINKNQIFEGLAIVLNNLCGSVYTGCDVNTNQEDMEELSKHTQYILSALGTKVDGSSATAYGLRGTISALLKKSNNDSNRKKILVYGIGKVGSILVDLLLEHQYDVVCFDIIPNRAEIQGCKNVSMNKDFWQEPYDLIAFCSPHDPITSQIAEKLQCHFLAGSTNELFMDSNTNKILQEKNIVALPASISSAGAIISDSIEKYSPEIFKKVAPTIVYYFVENEIYQKTAMILKALISSKQIPSADFIQSQLHRFYSKTPPFCGEKIKTIF